MFFFHNGSWLVSVPFFCGKVINFIILCMFIQKQEPLRSVRFILYQCNPNLRWIRQAGRLCCNGEDETHPLSHGRASVPIGLLRQEQPEVSRGCLVGEFGSCITFVPNPPCFPSCMLTILPSAPPPWNAPLLPPHCCLSACFPPLLPQT